MEALLLPLLPLFTGLLLVLIPICFYRRRSTGSTAASDAKGCRAPRAGGAWPIFGHLHLFGAHQLTHKTLAAMADKYGPAFTIRLGLNEILVLSSSEMARECFTVHDRVFSTRPTVTASKILSYDFAMFGFAPYGSYWREIRKIVTVELLSNHRLNSLEHIRASEVGTSIRELYEMWVRERSTDGKVLVDMKQWFGDLTLNLAMRLVGGKRYFGASSADTKEREVYQKVMRDFFALFGVFVLSDAIPVLGLFDLKGHKKSMKRTAKRLDCLIGGWLQEHKEKRLLDGEGKDDQDFMDVMLRVMEGASFSGFDADTVIKATCLNLILGGSDTTKVTLTWVLSLLFNHPHVLKKAQAELDIQVGKDRKVDESDIKNLVYLQAIIKETLRLYPPAPIISPRAAMEDCTLAAGYKISAGTHLMVNVWKIHRDVRVWSNPEEFWPERFMTSHKNIDVRGQDFELIPFGSGRRSCPGISLALQVAHFALASLLHSFEVANPSDEDVDMTESPGLTNMKATPLEVLLRPRFNSEFYGRRT